MFTLLKMLGFGPAIKAIAPGQARQAVGAGEVIIIDVRNAEEWEQSGTPRGSHRISLSDPRFEEKIEALARPNPDTIIAISCLTGMRSRAAAKRLRKRGIDKVQVVKGGITGWKSAGLPIDR